MSDSEQCSNRLELDLISLLVNFSCELGQIMTRYDFLWAIWVILSNVRTNLNLTQFNFWSSFHVNGANNDQIWLPMGYMSDSEQCSNWLELYLISLFVNFSCELGQILTRYDSYLVIICPNSHEKLTKSEIRSSSSRFEHFSESLI